MGSCTDNVSSRVEMKINLTLNLDQDVLRELQIVAAEAGLSINALLAAKLDEIVHRRREYNRSRRSALARLSKGFNLGWAPPRSRAELHRR